MNLCHGPVNTPPRPHFAPMEDKLLLDWAKFCHILPFLSIQKLQQVGLNASPYFQSCGAGLEQSLIRRSELRSRSDPPTPEIRTVKVAFHRVPTFSVLGGLGGRKENWYAVERVRAGPDSDVLW